MRYPPGRKRETRARIVEAGARAFKRHGFKGAGIDGVMSEAGLTSGAFYRHFESKDALFAEVISSALTTNQGQRQEGLEGLSGLDWVAGLIHRYLSPEHLSRVEDGCPIPSLASEIGRATPAAKSAMEAGIEEWREQICARLPLGDRAESEALAAQLISTMIGAMTLARSMPDKNALAFLEQASAETVRSLRQRCKPPQDAN